MYSDHFGLVQNPFTPLSTAYRPFRSKELQEALAHFQYARLNRESFFLLVGEVGVGKSTAVRAMTASLGPRTPVALLSHTRLDPRELLEEVLRRFGIESGGTSSKSQILGRLEEFLSSSAEESPAVLILDEAHLLSHAALEEIRLLSNLEHRGRPLLQICLVGQPELLERLRQHRLRPLRQRISVRYVFGSLTRSESRQYIRHRLEAAGASDPAATFTDDAADAVHDMAEGLPREINVLAGQAMLNAYLENSPTVKRQHVRTTKHDYGFEGLSVAPSTAPAPSDREAPEPGASPPQSLASDSSEPVLPEEEVSILEAEPSITGRRTLLIATAVAALGILATLALLLYPRNLVGKALPDPTSGTSARPVDAPKPVTAPAPAPPEIPHSTTTSPPEPEPVREEAPAVDADPPQAISIAPQPVSRAAAAADRLERGTWLARNGSLDAAIAAFREALALEPGYGDAFYNLGVSLLERGDLVEAIEALRKATSISPNHGLAQRSLGIALRQSGAVIEAAASLSRAVELLPNDVFALRHLAAVLRESGELEKAIDATRKAVALMPGDAGLHQELGFTLRAAGRLPEATTALQRSVDLDGNLALAHYTLGVTLLEMGNRDAGEREIEAARQLGYDPR